MHHFCKRKIYFLCPLIQQNISASQIQKQSCQNKCNIVFQVHVSEFTAQAVHPHSGHVGLFISLKNDTRVPSMQKLPCCPWEMLSVQMKQQATRRYQRELWQGSGDTSIVAIPSVAGVGKVIDPQVYSTIFNLVLFVFLF